MSARHAVDSITSDELDALYDQLDRVRALHQQDGDHCTTCTEDFGRLSAPWPCPTARALDDTDQPDEEREKTTRVFTGLHRSAEADVTRVIDLYEQWVKTGPPPLGTSMARWWDARLVELHDAIRPPAGQPKEQQP
ncbi:hypothetical protein ACFYQA_08425 [Streptomyces sp. NPDC005774]|uniref:hypothetical protein n=1 Tax=Streptomyces sp. NPDC005774 TaxID=3364728 RepID=UPI0036866372